MYTHAGGTSLEDSHHRSNRDATRLISTLMGFQRMTVIEISALKWSYSTAYKNMEHLPSQYNRLWSSSTMFLTITSPLSNVICNSIYFYAHFTKFGWILDQYVINPSAKFYRQILARNGIKIQQVFLAHPISKHMPPNFNGSWFMMLLMCIPSFIAKFCWWGESQCMYHTLNHYFSTFKHNFELNLFLCSRHQFWIDVGS